MKTIVTSSVKKAASFILKHEPVGMPTETVYGLAANVFDEEAIRKIFHIKSRPADNPLIVHISDLSQIELMVKRISRSAEKIIERFFPGPVTIVLKKLEIIPDLVSAGLDSIAIRMPELEISRRFIKECGVPLAAPSANISGGPSPTAWEHVYHDLNGKVACILKGPKSRVGLESTVIDCSGAEPVILRPGIITLSTLKAVLPKIHLHRTGEDHQHRSPGMKYRHYSPNARVILVNDIEEIPAGIIEDHRNEIAFIGKSQNSIKIKKKLVKDDNDYGHYLFNFFRYCDKKGVKIIYCQKVKEEGVGLALMNRLIKAARK